MFQSKAQVINGKLPGPGLDVRLSLIGGPGGWSNGGAGGLSKFAEEEECTSG